MRSGDGITRLLISERFLHCISEGGSFHFGTHVPQFYLNGPLDLQTWACVFLLGTITFIWKNMIPNVWVQCEDDQVLRYDPFFQRIISSCLFWTTFCIVTLNIPIPCKFKFILQFSTKIIDKLTSEMNSIKCAWIVERGLFLSFLCPSRLIIVF